MRRIHTIASLVVSLGLFAMAAPAFAGDTFFVDSATGSDANTCTSAAQACLTIAHATDLIIDQANPQNSTLKLNGTFNEAIAFDSGYVASDATLDGLHITATNTDTKPIIDATGNMYGVQVSNINDVTIDHLEVTGSQVGISVNGQTTTAATNIFIHHNLVTALTADPDFTAIELQFAKQSTIEHNRIADINTETTDASGYTTSKGVYLYNVRGSAVRNNTISNLTISNDSVASNSGRSTYLYGFNGTVLADVIFKRNTIDGLSVTESSSLANTTHSDLVAGLYITAASAVQVSHHSLSNISASGVAPGIAGVSITNQAYGLYLSDIRSGVGVNTISNNTIQTVTAAQDTVSGAAYAYGMRLETIYNAVVNDNVIKTLTASGNGSLDGGTYTDYVYGIYGPYFGDDLLIANNTLRDFSAIINYTGDNSYSYPTIKGINMYGAAATVSDNTLRNFTWAVQQNGAASPNDYPYLSGIEAAYNDDVSITSNTLRDFSGTYADTGEEAYISPNLYGIYLNTTNGAVVRNNTVRSWDFDYTFADDTNTSYGYQYLEPFYLRNSSSLTVVNNAIKQVTLTADNNMSNSMYLYVYGYYLYNSDGTISDNQLTGLTVNNTSTNGSTLNNITGLYVSGLGESVLDHNLFKHWEVTSTSTNAGQVVSGIYLTAGKPLVVNANQVRHINTASANIQEVTGISLYTDASSARIFNNIVLGQADSTDAGTSIGIYLPSDSTTDVDVVNNTVSNWRYPIEINGGNKVQLLNNILAANMDNGYALALKLDHINLDNFQSDYNLLHTTQGKAQAVYNLDGSAISFEDWTDTDGSYSYDNHSLYHKAGISSSGRLSGTSAAVGHGSNQFNYDSNDLAYTLIHTDLNGTARPAANGSVDIGADQHQ